MSQMAYDNVVSAPGSLTRYTNPKTNVKMVSRSSGLATAQTLPRLDPTYLSRTSIFRKFQSSLSSVPPKPSLLTAERASRDKRLTARAPPSPHRDTEAHSFHHVELPRQSLRRRSIVPPRAPGRPIPRC